MTTDRNCRWVRPRLPLLAGGELGIGERRQVERHLIGCLGCRARRDSSGNSLAALRSVAALSPTTAGAPSLWPALDRQIRASRHAPARRPWLDRLGLGLRSVLAPWPALGLGFLGLMTGAVAMVAISPTPATSPEARVVRSSKPRGALPETPSRPPAPDLAKTAGDPFAPPPSIRFEYVLDRVAPVGPGGNSRDPQRSY